MRHKLLVILGFIVVLTTLIAMTGAPVAATQTDDLLEGYAQLDNAQIYFSEDNGEASRFDRSARGLSRLGGLLQQLGADLYTLEWRRPIPADADLVVIAGPFDDLTSSQIVRLWMYLREGGRLLLLVDPPIARVRPLPAARGLFELTWNDLGIRGLDNMVATEGPLHTVAPPQEEPDEDAEGPTPTPPAEIETPTLLIDFTTTSLNASHPITADLQGEIGFFGARSLEVDSSISLSSSEAQALAFSPADYYGETRYDDYRNTGIAEYDETVDAVRGPQPLIAAAGEPASGMRVVLIGDRDFATNGGGLQTSPANSPSFLYPTNADLLLNSITWLLEADAVELSFPTPGPTSTPTVTPTAAPEEEEAD